MLWIWPENGFIWVVPKFSKFSLLVPIVILSALYVGFLGLVSIFFRSDTLGYLHVVCLILHVSVEHTSVWCGELKKGFYGWSGRGFRGPNPRRKGFTFFLILGWQIKVRANKMKTIVFSLKWYFISEKNI